jgi:hypothetical protein
MFAQLRARERRMGRVGSLFFWRDHTREVDFVIDIAEKLELFEAKWNEVPTVADSVNMEFVRDVVGKPRTCRRRGGLPDLKKLLPSERLSSPRGDRHSLARHVNQ